jgi:hypothetical protein
MGNTNVKTALLASLRLVPGSAIVSIAHSRRPADWLRNRSLSTSHKAPESSDAFGGTPKAADGDVRAPRPICLDTLIL